MGLQSGIWTGNLLLPALAVLGALLALLALPARAEPLPASCRSYLPMEGRVISVALDGSIVLDVFASLLRPENTSPAQSHETVRLADIGNDEGARKTSLQPALHALIGRRIVAHPLYPAPDRWGRVVSHVEVLSGESAPPSSVWLQADLVRAGLVEVRPQGSHVGCAGALYKGETAARNAGRGLWRGTGPRLAKQRRNASVSAGSQAHDPDARRGSKQGILSASDAHLSRQANAYRIVAGIVVSVGATSRTLYLNFGRDWSRDFTVTIPVDREVAFREAGRDPKALAGRYVRVRGWMREWNGAQIEVRHPDQIEVF
ncbi:hypothetical protein [Breoghania sp.]|uniref:thermonuclease family protein n=1 Tax=Breoghania sp. TaxID=2065378 RepID=UPI002AAC1D90|nr:hypothetical protein [Breoghania sp.]